MNELKPLHGIMYMGSRFQAAPQLSPLVEQRFLTNPKARRKGSYTATVSLRSGEFKERRWNLLFREDVACRMNT